MIGYKISRGQRDFLVGQKLSNGNRYNPVKDINGDWFIFEEEHKECELGRETYYFLPKEELEE